MLADLLTAIRVNDAVGLETQPLLERYRNIQRALVQAVGEVHIKLSRVPVSTRNAISDAMKQFEWVFTTSYDLLVYWAMAAAGFEPFMDHFRHRGRSAHDSHLAEALSENPGRPVAISMLPAPKKELLARQVDISGRVEANPLLFFNANSHPLGNSALAVPANP